MGRKTLSQIKHNPTPQELYDALMESEGWHYKTNPQKYLMRDRSFVAVVYVGDFRAEEAIPLTTANFEMKDNYLWIKDVIVGKTRKLTYREAKLPFVGPRKCFTDLVIEYIDTLKPTQRLYPWSTTKRVYQLPAKYDYKLKDGTEKHRYSVQMVGTKRAWQIVNALLPNYTQHWLRAFGYNFDYDHMQHDIMAVSDKTKADPQSLQPYLRRRYEKYSVR